MHHSLIKLANNWLHNLIKTYQETDTSCSNKENKQVNRNLHSDLTYLDKDLGFGGVRRTRDLDYVTEAERYAMKRRYRYDKRSFRENSGNHLPPALVASDPLSWLSRSHLPSTLSLTLSLFPLEFISSEVTDYFYLCPDRPIRVLAKPAEMVCTSPF